MAIMNSSLRKAAVALFASVCALSQTASGTTYIPADYTPLEYVTIPRCDSSRNSVATGLNWSDVKRIDFSYATTDTRKTEFIAFACYKGTDFATVSNPFIYMNFTGSSSVSLSANNVTATAAFSPSSSYAKDGSFLSVSLTDVTTTSEGLVCFGDAWSDGAHSISADWGEVSFYGADDVLLAHYAPCKRISDNEVGFYETVSKTFATKSVATWDGFTAGPEKAREPYLFVTGVPVECGDPAPGYGVDTAVADGVAKEYAAPAVCTNASGDVELICAGWELTRLDGTLVDSGLATNVSVTYSSDVANATLTWKWSVGACRISATAGTGGTVNVGERWLREGESMEFAAYSASGYSFSHWAGDIAEEDKYRNPLTIAFDGEARAVQAVFAEGESFAGEPSLIAEKSVLWLDASKSETLLLDETGNVTNWISRDASGKIAKPQTGDGYTPPTYDATNYGQVCVDFGTTGSGKDLTFSSTTFKTAFFCVKIEQKLGAFLIGSSNCVAHRGSNGEWKYSGGSSNVQEAWQDGEKVTTSLTATKMPDDDFYVFAVRSSSSTTTQLTRDRAFLERTGGRQLSEAIFFGELTDDEVSVVNQYLLRKWKLDPTVSVSGTPTARGTVTPAYGSYTNFVKGTSYSFSASAAVTNDSRSLASVCQGWTLVRSDFTSVSGTETETSFIHDGMTSYASLTWNWSDWIRLPLDRGSELPRGYRCIEYVEQSDDQARIDTGITLSAETTDILFTVGAKDNTFYATNTVESNGDQKWLGMNGGPGFFLGRLKDNWRLSTMGSLTEGITGYSQSLGPLTVAITGGNWYFMPPESETEYKSYVLGDCAHPTTSANDPHLFLFHCGGGESTYRWAPAGTRIYQVEIYEGATCAHRLVACRRKGDRKPGFYDTVTGVFHTNTTGTLLAGPDDRRFLKGMAILFR